MTRPNFFPALLLPVLMCCPLSPRALAAADKPQDWEGPLVLKVNGKDVTLKASSSNYTVGDEDGPVAFSMDSTTFILAGEFDLNGDRKLDRKDKPTASGALSPAALLNKRVILSPTEDDSATAQNYVEIPGVGRCALLKGSTLTITQYKKTGRPVDRWSGTVKLNLKPENGAAAFQADGRFECGIRPES